MPFVHFESTMRRHAGEKAPNNSPFEPGGKIRVHNVGKKGWAKRPITGVVIASEWVHDGDHGQWVVQEAHITRRGNAVERTVKTGYAQVEVEVDGKTEGPLDMHGPERAPFFKGAAIRYSNKTSPRSNLQNWNYATVLDVYMEQGLREPRWTFLVQPAALGGMVQKPEVIGFTKFDIQDAASRKHFA